ncbi:MAG: ChbG/HpnK family deacetylase [Candidatus Rokubacteria bacterium]|nr:ChbG/HpnK family deacetylase [Candidatus Rokubacteria bacterium]
MKRLIVNADDFGLTAGVSRGILEAHRKGIVTSTTMLVNREVDPALVEELKGSDLGVGLHLNLTLGTPVSDPTRVPSLVDGEGAFIRDAREAAARATADEARIELGTQIDAFRKLMGRFPSHLDSHHHVGRHAPIQGLIFDFARALKLPVRSPDDRVRAAARRLKLRTPDHFFGESGPEPCWSAERLLAQLASLPDGVSEFMTHPGYFDRDLAYSRYGRQREEELRGLTDPAVREAVVARGICLCHFGELA